MTNLPHRLTESAFRSFEPTIADVVRNYPDITLISRGNRSANTVSARLRDAMASLHRFSWPSVIVDLAKFRVTYPLIQVAHRNEQIVAGSKEAIAKHFAEPSDSLASLPLDVLSTPSPTFVITYGDGQLLCRLAAAKCLACPISVRGVDEEMARNLENNFDARVDKQNDGTYLIS